jgi:hypothetical protein
MGYMSSALSPGSASLCKTRSVGYDPTKCRHGTWPSSQLVDGKFARMLQQYITALELLTASLEVAERDAVSPRSPEYGVRVGGTTRTDLANRLTRAGTLHGEEVKELRKIREKVSSRLAATIHALWKGRPGPENAAARPQAR